MGWRQVHSHMNFYSVFITVITTTILITTNVIGIFLACKLFSLIIDIIFKNYLHAFSFLTLSSLFLSVPHIYYALYEIYIISDGTRNKAPDPLEHMECLWFEFWRWLKESYIRE